MGVGTLPTAGLEILFKHNRCFHRVWEGDLSSEKLPGEAV